MFSPFYAWSRRYGQGDPYQHVCLNVALYGRTRRWAMTERTRRAMTSEAAQLTLGPSALRWDGNSLVVTIEERGAPIPSRISGEIRLHPLALTGRRFALDEAGRHRWAPIAPSCRVEVRLQRPAMAWSGTGYLDSNEGERPLEADFLRWDWCRAPMREGTAILYDADRVSGGSRCLALRVGADGRVAGFEPPPRVTLPPTLWRLGRTTRSEGAVAVRERLEDAPFYARSVIETGLLGERPIAVHESLSLTRFRRPWVQAMLPFRIPRRW